MELVIPPGYDTPSQQPFSIHPLGEPSRFPLPETNKQIFDNGYEYVYRLALCVSPEYVNGTYGGDLTKVRQWVREIGEYLNMVYQRDLGIRFIVIEDDKLLLTDSPNYPIEDSYGTKIINEKIGTEAYDCGILIRPTHNGLSGRTLLGGVYQSYNKGNAMANSDMATIAHELGHLFGAKHTHQKNDALCTEPGYGQSIMSYGEPRNAFALSSVLAIRSRLKSQCYYTSSDRNPNEIEGGIPEPDANIPYVVKSTYTKPVLDRRQLRSNYTIPEGTNFQFYLRLPIPPLRSHTELKPIIQVSTVTKPMPSSRLTTSGNIPASCSSRIMTKGITKKARPMPFWLPILMHSVPAAISSCCRAPDHGRYDMNRSIYTSSRASPLR